MDFILRNWKQEDAESLVKYASNKRIYDNLRNAFPHPYTIDNAKAFLKVYTEGSMDRFLCRAISINGEAVGSIGIFLKDDVYEKSAEIGYWLGEPFWNRGIMTGAIKLICSEAFSRFDIVRIYAEPFSVNKGSRRALEKAGFNLEGILKKSIYKNGRVIDSCIYAMLK